jgi:hypothetical protein
MFLSQICTSFDRNCKYTSDKAGKATAMLLAHKLPEKGILCQGDISSQQQLVRFSMEQLLLYSNGFFLDW